MASFLRTVCASVLRSTQLVRPSELQQVRSFSILSKINVCNVLASASPSAPIQIPVRTFKDMDVLTKRCKDCYFKKDDDRWYVLCKTHGRHKQRQRLPDKRHFWIVTHRTHGPRKNF
ncbi:hypothetical protein HPB47_008402 [Ixodes persulcatus]|uniref:Uncharacterized protein n=1 Tax=Ixodes persulcatus TaxID=34615 RepID=A0AC60P5S2_IXOPE|nr:hypothetical protein HPB47_008402 [Ixodes persulcatus]